MQYVYIHLNCLLKGLNLHIFITELVNFEDFLNTKLTQRFVLRIKYFYDHLVGTQISFHFKTFVHFKYTKQLNVLNF